TLMFHTADAGYQGEDAFDHPQKGPARMFYPSAISDTTAAADAAAGAMPNIGQYWLFPRPTPDPALSYEDIYAKASSVGFHPGDSGTVVINDEGRVIAQLVRAVTRSFLSDMKMPMSEMEWG